MWDWDIYYLDENGEPKHERVRSESFVTLAKDMTRYGTVLKAIREDFNATERKHNGEWQDV